jgi:hypothetical protein
MTRSPVARRGLLRAEEEPSQRIRHFPSKRPKPEPIDSRGSSTIQSRRYRPIGRSGRLPRQNARLSPSTSRDRSKPSVRLGKVSNPLTPAVGNSNRNYRLPPSCLRRKTASCKKRHSPPHSIQKHAALGRDAETGVAVEALAADYRDLQALRQTRQSGCRTWFRIQLSTLCH